MWFLNILTVVTGLVWAGVSLGGLVAAPAKFQAPNISLEIALEVGRAQFQWVGLVEWSLLAMLVTGIGLTGGRGWAVFAVPILIFLAQRLVIMPPLDARTSLVISGTNVDSSPLHLIFILAEILKFMGLTVASALILAGKCGTLPFTR